MKRTRSTEETPWRPPGGWPWIGPPAVGTQTVIIITDRAQTEQLLRTILPSGRGLPQ